MIIVDKLILPSKSTGKLLMVDGVIDLQRTRDIGKIN